MLTKAYINEIKEKNDIVSVISEHIKLKSNGQKYIGEAFINNEKTLIYVNPEQQSYTNLNAYTTSDVIDFLSQYKDISPYEAIKELAERANMSLPSLNIDEKLKEKERVIEINKEAAKFYYKMLYSNKGAEGLKYFKQRGLDDETIKKFGLGYAPKEWTALTKYIEAKGYSKDEMLNSGLFGLDDKGKLRDKFVGRVMFPIVNDKKKVVAFGGRILDDSKPKYINSPETIAYHKSDNLYAWNVIKDSNKGNLIICEGYMDVLAMQQAGFNQACASLGTAFTKEQARILGRYTNNILLAYDSDEAGTKAAIKNIGILKEHGLNGKVIDLTPYKDPDEFVKNLGKEEFQNRVDTAKEGNLYLLSKIEDKTSEEFKLLVAELILNEKKEERSTATASICKEYSLDADEIKKKVFEISEKVSKPSILSGSLDDVLKKLQDVHNSKSDIGKNTNIEREN